MIFGVSLQIQLSIVHPAFPNARFAVKLTTLAILIYTLEIVNVMQMGHVIMVHIGPCYKCACDISSPSFGALCHNTAGFGMPHTPSNGSSQ